MRNQWIYRLEELRSEHNDMVGKKCANLGEMTHLGMRVPPGFAVTVDGYERFMEETGTGREIKDYVRRNEQRLHKNVQAQVEAGRFIRSLIQSRTMPPAMKRELSEHYLRVCEAAGCPDVAVATRSSGAVSMPGQMETYLNVQGEDEVAEKVIQVWGSAFTTRAIAFRLEKGMPMDKAPIGVAVLKMVNAKCAGVALTVIPTTGDLSGVVIEGNWGLGESVVSGEITPDTFIVNKETGEIHSTINPKPKMVAYKAQGTAVTRVPEELQEKPCLEEEEIREIVRIALNVEAHFDMPQDMEWVFDRDLPFPENLFWVQTRPAKFSPKKEKDSEYLAELMTRVFKM